jgi:hypothetical protein
VNAGDVRAHIRAECGQDHALGTSVLFSSIAPDPTMS